jgi:hypothetical protein
MILDLASIVGCWDCHRNQRARRLHILWEFELLTKTRWLREADPGEDQHSSIPDHFTSQTILPPRLFE